MALAQNVIRAELRVAEMNMERADQNLRKAEKLQWEEMMLKSMSDWAHYRSRRKFFLEELLRAQLREWNNGAERTKSGRFVPTVRNHPRWKGRNSYHQNG